MYRVDQESRPLRLEAHLLLISSKCLHQFLWLLAHFNIVLFWTHPFFHVPQNYHTKWRQLAKV